MDILSNLTELIKTRKEVGVSGLGTFYKKKSPGRYDVETHAFLPPAYTLHFTSEINEQVSLIEFVSKSRDISADSAAYFIDQFAEEIKKQLEDDQEAHLGALGKLSAAPEGLVFSSSDETIFGFDFYGLPSFKDEVVLPGNKELADDPATSEQIIVDEAAKQQAENVKHGRDIRNDNLDFDAQKEAPIQQSKVSEEQLDLEDHNADLRDGSSENTTDTPVVLIETPESIHEDSEFIQDSPTFSKASTFNFANPGYIEEANEEQEHKIPVYLKVIIACLIVLGILTAIYFINPKLLNSYINNKSPEETSKAAVGAVQLQVDSAKHADSIKNAETVISTTDSLKDSLSVISQVLADTATTWEVIGASIINQKEVDKFISQMKTIGITAKVIPTIPGKRRIKISVGTFYDEASARAGRRELVVKLKNPDLYIYQNKHTHKPE